MSHSLTIESGAKLPRIGLMPWLVCLSAGLFFFYEFFQLNIFDVINHALRVDYQLDATALSWMSSMFLWADILFLLPAGILLDRYSPRCIILIAMFICVSGTLGFALTHSFIQACLFHALTGIGHAFCFLACVVLIARWFPPQKQAMLIGIVVTMAFLGGMAAHTPFAHLVELYGWRTALLVDALLGFVFLIWVFFTVFDAPDLENTRQEPKKQLLMGFIKAIKNRHTWTGGLYTTFLNLPIMILCALWGASYLETVHYLTEFSAAATINFVFIGSIFGCPIAGWLSDTQGRRKPLMIIGALAALLSLIPFFTLSVISEPLLKILFFSLGFFTSTQVISYPLIAESNASENTGIATGIASVLIMGGGGLGQLVFGWLMQHHATVNGQYTSVDFQYAMWIFPLTTVFGLIAVLFSRETYCKRSD